MPEQYVYQIVLDDSEVNRVIANIDKKITDLTQRMDIAFRNVGNGMGAGLQQASQQVEQANRRIQQAQQQSAQQSAQQSEQASQRVQRSQQQIDQAKRLSIRLTQQEIQQARQTVVAARDSGRAITDSVRSQSKEVQNLINLLNEQIAKLNQLKQQGTEFPKAITSHQTASEFYDWVASRPDIDRIQGSPVERDEEGRVRGIKDYGTEFQQAQNFDVDYIYQNRKAMNDFVAGMRERNVIATQRTQEEIASTKGQLVSKIGERRETQEMLGPSQDDIANAEAAYAQVAQSRRDLAQQIQQTAQQQSATETQAAQQTAQAVQQSEQQTVQATQQAGEQRRQISVQTAQQITQARQQELAQAQEAFNVAQQEANVARQASEAKRRAARDAGEAAAQAAERAKTAAADLAQAEEEGSTSAIDSLQKRKEKREEEAEAARKAAEVARKEAQVAGDASKDAAEKQKLAAQARVEAGKRVTDASKQEKAAEKQLATETRALAKERTEAAKREREAERQFIRTTKTFGQQRNALDELVKRNGAFTVSIGKSASEMNSLEKEVNDIIRSDKQLSDEIDKLIAKNNEFNVSVDRGTFAGGPPQGVARGQFRQAGFAAQRLGIPGAAAFGEAAAVGGAAGVAIAGVALSTKALIGLFKDLAGVAKNAFETIVKGSIEAAKEIEVARAQFTAIFQQDTLAAEAALQRLQQLSVKLGENVVGIGRAFLPEVENLDQLEQIVEAATALARFQPEQGILGARIALQEALAGEFRSLQRRFEISPVAIDQIREAFQAEGVTGFLRELQSELERTGRSVEDLSDTFGVSVGRIRERWRQLLQQIGDPIIEELKDQLGGIDDELERLSPDLVAIGVGFGDLVSKLVEMVGVEVENFLENFDPEALFALLEALTRAVESFQIVVIALDAGASSANALETVLYGLAGALINLEGYFLSTSLAIARAREELVYFLPLIKAAAEASDIGGKMFGGNYGAALDYGEAVLDITAALLESGGTLEDVEAAMAAYEKRMENFPKTLEEFKESLKSSNDEGDRAANTFLTIQSKISDLISIQEQYRATQEEVNKEVEEFNIQAALRFEKILTDARRNRLEFEIESAEKLIDIERKNAERISDIRSNFTNQVIAAGVDLADRESDIIRKHGDAVLDLEEDLNDKRLEEEERYRDELERIRDRFNFQAFEAMLANDGKLLRQIRRRQAFEEDQAKKDRDRNIRDVDSDGDDRRKKLQVSLDREIRDARIANARKIRDLETSLNDQLAKQEEARRRDIEQQAIAERRKRQELKDSLTEQLEDYGIWWAERNRVTQEGIADDLKQLQDYAESAREIIDTLQALGVGFNPTTGQPEFLFSQQNIQQEETPGIKQIQERVIALQVAEDVTRGTSRDIQEVRDEITDLNVSDLVEKLDDLQRSIDPQIIEGVMGAFGETTLDTQDLARKLLLDQAVFLGEQVGKSVGDITAQTAILSLKDLQKWVSEFIAKYSVMELPEFSLFGMTPAEMLAQGGGMSGVSPFLAPPGPQSSLIPSQQTPFTQGAQSPLVPGQASPNVNDASNVQGFFTVQGQNVPQIQGTPQFIFPNVTDAPFTPIETPQQPFVPGFNEAVTGGGDLNNQLLPGNIMPNNPAYGFDVEGFEEELQSQVDAQIMAELLKRGEIEDTVAFAELIAEREAIAVESLLNDQVEQYQITGDQQIAILENTLRRQQETLDALRSTEGMEDEIAVLEQSIAILEDTLKEKREELAGITEGFLKSEINAHRKAEEEKQDVITETGDVAQSVDQRKGQRAREILSSVTKSTRDEAQAQTAVIQDQGAKQTSFRRDQRQLEVEEEAEHSETRQKQLSDGFRGEVIQLNRFWTAWLDLEQRGIMNDLRLLNDWVRNRNRIIQQAVTTIPGIGTIPGDDPETTTTSSGGTATQAQLTGLALTYGQQIGMTPAEINASIANMTMDELIAFVEWLQNQAKGLALGGSFQPGEMLKLAELGVSELVSFNKTGTVEPISSLLFRSTPPVGIGGGTTINNNSNLGGFNFPDPRGLPPTYLKMMEVMAANMIRQAWAGRI